MAVVNLRNLDELAHALRALGKKVEKEAIQGMRNAARFGATAVLRTSAKEKRRPKAAGTYERSWLVHTLDDGATVSNSARHAIFVERGRRSGRAPPIEPILEWVYQKRLASRARASKLRKRKGKTILARTPSAMKEGDRAMAIARAVQRKIARKGTPGRWILRKTMPTIAKRATLELRRAVRKIVNKPPR